MRDREVVYYLISAGSVASVFLLWNFVVARVVAPLWFPTPEMVYEAVKTLNTQLFVDMWATAWRVLAGLLLGTMVGVGVAVLMSASRIITAVLDPLIEVLRPMPALALIPFFVLWFGVGDLGKILLIALGVFLIVVVTVFEAIAHVSPVYVNAARSLGMNTATIYRTVLLPASLPAFWSSMRVAAAASFGLGIAAEFMGAQNGLGYLILLSRRTLSTEVMLLGVIGIGFLSYMLDRVVRVCAARTTRWAPRRGR